MDSISNLIPNGKLPSLQSQNQDSPSIRKTITTPEKKESAQQSLPPINAPFVPSAPRQERSPHHLDTSSPLHSKGGPETHALPQLNAPFSPFSRTSDKIFVRLHDIDTSSMSAYQKSIVTNGYTLAEALLLNLNINAVGTNQFSV